jgi:hypothetical protein
MDSHRLSLKKTTSSSKLLAILAQTKELSPIVKRSSRSAVICKETVVQRCPQTQQLESQSCFTGVVRAGWLYVDGYIERNLLGILLLMPTVQITSWFSTPADKSRRRIDGGRARLHEFQGEGMRRKSVNGWKEVVRARVCMDRVILFSIDYISCGSLSSQSVFGRNATRFSPPTFRSSDPITFFTKWKSTYFTFCLFCSSGPHIC